MKKKNEIMVNNDLRLYSKERALCCSRVKQSLDGLLIVSVVGSGTVSSAIAAGDAEDDESTVCDPDLRSETPEELAVNEKAPED